MIDNTKIEEAAKKYAIYFQRKEVSNESKTS